MVLKKSAHALLASDTFTLFTVVVCFGIGVALQKHAVHSYVSRQKNKNAAAVVRSFWNPLWLLGSSMGFVALLFYFQAVSRMDISFVQPMINFSVVIALFISIVFLHEKISPGEGAGVLLILGGGFFLFKGGISSDSSGMVVKQLTSFIVFSLFISACFTLLLKKAKRIVLREILAALLSGALKGIAAVLAKATTYIVEQHIHEYHVLTFSTWKAQLSNVPFWLMVIANVAGYGIMQYAFSFGRASVIVPVETMATFLLPVFAGIFVFSENMNHWRMTGLLIITAGIFVLLLSTRKKKEVITTV